MKKFSNYAACVNNAKFLAAALFALLLSAAFSQTVFAQEVSLESTDRNIQISKTKGVREITEVNNVEAPLAPQVATISNYGFSTATGVALEDMTVSTVIRAAGIDDAPSAFTNIGFDFFFMGARYSQFCASPDGWARLVNPGSTACADQFTNALSSTTNTPKLSPHWNDLATGANGNVRFKLVGAAPNRKLVVQWFVTVPRATSGAANATFQAWMFEGTGVVQYVYGASAVDTSYSVGLTTTTGTFASVTVATNTNSFVTANDTQTTAMTAGRTYIYTPPVLAGTEPSGLNFTTVAPTSVTLNWVDNSTNEAGFPIYFSTDGGTTYNFLATAPENATSFNATGLSPSTTYFFRVYAVTEGFVSTAFTQNSVTTAAPGNVVSTATGGPWSAPATWVGGVVPTASDNAVIADGATVTIDIAAAALNLTVGQGGAGASTLQYEGTTARILTIGSSVTVAANGVFQSNLADGALTHTLSLPGNLTNNGVLDFSTNGDTASTTITFAAGAPNVTFGGTGATTDVRAITVAKGALGTIVELTTTNFTVRGVTTDVAGFLTLTSGTFKISGTFTGTNRVFTGVNYVIAATAGFWLNNPNYTVAGQAQGGLNTTSNNGLLRITQGIFNVGVGAGDELNGGAGAQFIIEGGTLNSAGRIDPQTAVVYNQSGGTVNVATVGNTRSGFGSFEIFSGTASFTMSGGTINIVNPSTGASKIDYTLTTATVLNITGGQIVFGGGAAPPNSTYTVGFASSIGNFTVNPTQTLNINATTLTAVGATITNDGAITSTGAGRFDFAATTPMTYGGAGTFGTAAAPFGTTGIGSSTTTLKTLNAPIVTTRVNLFAGGFVNSNQITLGNGGTSAATVQIGQAGATTPGGSFDVSPVFNVGTGGYSLLYALETTARTTGFEIPATRTINSLSVSNTNGLTIAGGDLTVAQTSTALLGTISLTGGIVFTGANTLIHVSPGTITRTASATSNFIVGNLSRSYTAIGTYTYFVGDNTGTAEYSPMTATVTALTTNPSALTVSVVDAVLPGLNTTTSASRYWNLTETGDLTADLSFTYVEADTADVTVDTDEAGYRVFKNEAGAVTNQCGTPCVNTTTNVAGPVTGVSAFSAWGVGTELAPTAASVDVGGRIREANGRGIFRARVTMTDSAGNVRMAFTNQFGYYRFGSVAAGGTYIFSAAHRRYQFDQPTQVRFISEATESINFTTSGENPGFRPEATFFDNAPFDFDGDGRTDVAVFRSSDNTWYINRSSDNTLFAQAFGAAGDRLAPADFDGDGKTDLAVFRASEGNWYIWLSASNSLRVEKFGAESDRAIPADFDGDGKADVSVWNEMRGTWQVKLSTNGTIVSEKFTNGKGNFTPIASDRDGDGKADFVFFNSLNATWTIRTSSGANIKEQFGQSGDRAVMGDFDGDAQGDLAVYRASENTWTIKLADGKELNDLRLSANADNPVLGDFDGDGKADAAGFGGGIWSVRQSVNGSVRQHQFGLADDTVIPSVR